MSFDESNPIYLAAIDLASKGLPITLSVGKEPLGGKDWGKHKWPIDEEFHQIKWAFFRNDNAVNVGLKLGPAGGIIDIEADSPEEEEAFAALFTGCDVPVTPTFRSARGKHRLFRYDERLSETLAGVVNYHHDKAKLGIRIGANCKQIHSVIPPSTNSDGTRREWLVSIDECEPAALPNVVINRIIEASKKLPAKGSSKASTTPAGAANERTVAACMSSLRRIKVEDGNDGTRRLYTYACRCVEHGLDDAQAVASIRIIEKTKPFPVGFDDAEIAARLRDAEKTVERGTLTIDDNAVTNAYIDFIEDEEGNEKKITVPLSMAEVLRRIRAKTDNWPRRVDTCLFIDDQDKHGIAWLGSTSAAFGWLQSLVGTVEWHSRVLGGVSREEAFAELQRTSLPYAAIEEVPHEPAIQGHYYACKIPSPGDGETLRELLQRFSPETDIDRDLLKAALMTFVWGGPGGTRPAFLITSEYGRGVGKTKNAEMLASVVGGTISFSTNDDIGEIRSRLLSPTGLSKRIPFLDNIKTLKFSWAELEALITAPMVSGKRMYVGEAQRPNVLTWVLTINSPSLSTDISQRVVVIKLKRPQYDGDWEETTSKFIAQNRQAIIADLIAALRAPAAKLASFTRWGTWEKDVLSRLPEPADAQKTIVDRQQAIDAERDEAEIIEEFFRDQLDKLGYDCRHSEIFIPSEISTRWLNWATNEKHKVTTAGKVLGQHIDEGKFTSIQRNKTKERGRGIIWIGDEVPSDSECRLDLGHKIAEQMRKREADSQGT